MLALTRKIGEKVMTGDEISVAILGFVGSHVHMGTNAPKKLEIHCEEICIKIQSESKDTDLKPFTISR